MWHRARWWYRIIHQSQCLKVVDSQWVDKWCCHRSLDRKLVMGLTRLIWVTLKIQCRFRLTFLKMKLVRKFRSVSQISLPHSHFTLLLCYTNLSISYKTSLIKVQNWLTTHTVASKPLSLPQESGRPSRIARKKERTSRSFLMKCSRLRVIMPTQVSMIQLKTIKEPKPVILGRPGN